MVTQGVTDFACILSRETLQDGMARETHPLSEHLKATGESLTDFATRVEMSRMQLYRIMNGDSTTTDTLRKISAATDGKVPVSALLGEAA